MSASDIPTGDSLAVVLDRMQRASNFASNGVLMATEYLGDRDPADVAAMYISAATSMLEEARRALSALREQG
jgi:hypothetical protein